MPTQLTADRTLTFGPVIAEGWTSRLHEVTQWRGRTPTDPLVAKVLRPVPFGWTVDDAAAANLLLRAAQREAIALRIAAGPGVPCVVEDRLGRNPRALLMNRLPGDRLSDQVQRAGPLPWMMARRTCLALLEILNRLHSAGWAHGDLQSDNVLLHHEHVFLVDFGAARGPGHPLTGAWTLGRHRSCSPEHLGGATLEPPWSASGPRCDIHQLGCLLLWMVTAEEPFRSCGLDEDYESSYLPRLAAWSAMPGFDKVHSWARLEDRLSSAAIGLLAKWLDPDPDVRPSDATSAVIELSEVVR